MAQAVCVSKVKRFVSACISASDSDDLCKSNILLGDPFTGGLVGSVPDVKCSSGNVAGLS